MAGVFRFPRRIVILLGIVVALFVAGNYVIQDVAEDRIAFTAQQAFEMPSKPRVDLSAFPIVLRVLQRRIPSATVTATDVPAPDGFVMRSLRITLTDIRVEGNVLGAPEDLRVVVGRGRAVAEADERQVNDYLKRRESGVTVSLQEGAVVGRARRDFEGREREFVARGVLSIRDGELHFDARRVTIDGEVPPASLEERARRKASFSVPLPLLPGDIRLGRLEVHKGYVRLAAEVRDYSLVAPD